MQYVNLVIKNECGQWNGCTTIPFFMFNAINDAVIIASKQDKQLSTILLMKFYIELSSSSSSSFSTVSISPSPTQNFINNINATCLTDNDYKHHPQKKSIENGIATSSFHCLGLFCLSIFFKDIGIFYLFIKFDEAAFLKVQQGRCHTTPVLDSKEALKMLSGLKFLEVQENIGEVIFNA